MYYPYLSLAGFGFGKTCDFRVFQQLFAEVEVDNSTETFTETRSDGVHIYDYSLILRRITVLVSEAAERLNRGGWGAHLSPSHAHTPTQIFQNALCVVRLHKQTSLQS